MPQITAVVRPGLAGFVLVLALAVPARAVVILTGDGQGNTAPAADNPFWHNVARISSASAVYLGHRWVITANHVTSAPVRFSDGTIGQIVPGSEVTLGAFPFATPDLKMFRLTADPGLLEVEIPTTSPKAGTAVMMIGAGFDRARNEVGWTLSATGEWIPAPITRASALGFNVQSSSHMRWGMNTVDSSQLSFVNGTLSFSTRFDLRGRPFEAQAVVGDSGGGVFRLVSGTWMLAGLMNSVTPFSNQPSGTVWFGNQTISADLASYRTQILKFVDAPDLPWQNQLNYFDVNRSGNVSPVDALLVINALKMARELTGTPGPTDPLLDVDGTGVLTSADAQRVLNFLRANPSSTASAQAGTNFVPEPSGILLAALGALLIGLCPRALTGRRTRWHLSMILARRATSLCKWLQLGWLRRRFAE